MADLDKKIAELNRRREALRGRGRRTGRPVSREAKIARHRQQIKLLRDEIIPSMEPGSYGYRVATNSLKGNQSELRMLTGHAKPGDRNRRGRIETQAIK